MENRIISNIVELDKLYKEPCQVWLERFKNGQLDAHKSFIEYEEEYAWLYKNSPYDLIAWEIKNNCFDWEKHSRYIAEYCPDNIDADKYNWKEYGWLIAKYCPNKIDVEKYNWEEYSWTIAMYCPEKLDANKFNWKNHSWIIAKYCPDKIYADKYNWEKYRWAVEKFCPEKLSLINNEKKNYQ